MNQCVHARAPDLGTRGMAYGMHPAHCLLPGRAPVDLLFAAGRHTTEIVTVIVNHAMPTRTEGEVSAGMLRQVATRTARRALGQGLGRLSGEEVWDRGGGRPAMIGVVTVVTHGPEATQRTPADRVVVRIRLLALDQAGHDHPHLTLATRVVEAETATEAGVGVCLTVGKEGATVEMTSGTVDPGHQNSTLSLQIHSVSRRQNDCLFAIKRFRYVLSYIYYVIRINVNHFAWNRHLRETA